jgi:hypothetical protein
MFAFFISDVSGCQLLAGQASDFRTLLAAARQLQQGFPGSILTCSNTSSGAMAVFVAQFPDQVIYLRDHSFGREVYGSYADQSDEDIWVHLTDDGYYDARPDPLDFLGQPCMLEAVKFTNQLILN